MLDCKMTGDWDELIRVLSNNPVKQAVDKARRRIGIRGASMVQKGIVSGAPGGKEFRALREFTIKQREERNGTRTTDPLKDSGDLIGSISYKLTGAADVFIGVKRGARRKGNEDIADIAAVHEFGRIIAVTPKMRVYLASQGFGLKQSTTYIFIPPRSFLRPVLESQEFQEAALETTKRQLKKVLAPRSTKRV